MSKRPPDFIGLGAQKAATSWIYACLYEHPQICMPVKEIHFFSRTRNWIKGYGWYEKIFEKCPIDTKVGEFSTSYLPNPDTPLRICQRYPEVKLIVSLRCPIDRAYSNYMNDIIAGIVRPEMPFEEALRVHPEYIEQGRYAKHLERYLGYFKKEQLLILIYEDSLKDPLRFIRSIYYFINVDPGFVPTMLHARVNPSRIPRSVKLDRCIDRVRPVLRKIGLESLWWFMKKTGIGGKIHALNTRSKNDKKGPSDATKRLIYEILKEDINSLEKLIGRKLTEWQA